MPTNIVVDISDPANQDAWGLHPVEGGVWTPGAYVAGSVASHDGSLYFANVQTSQEPGLGADWTRLIAAPWTSVVVWAPGLTCSADAPVTVVTYGGGIYFCIVSHTSGASFEPAKWLATVSASAGSLVEVAGGWNATTNTPALASGAGDNGAFYRVTTAGDTALDGVSAWNVDDLAVFLNGVWRKLRGDRVEAADIADASSAGRALLTAADVAAQRAALRVDQATLVADADQIVTAAMSRVVYASLTAARTVTLPTAATLTDGQELLVYDESGNCSPSKPITLAAAGIDLIGGAGSYVLAAAYAGVRLAKASPTRWTAFALGGIVTPPQGRLTLLSGTPVMASSVGGGTSITYTPYIGDQIPIWTGARFVSMPFEEMSQFLTDASKSPAAAVAGGSYDIFVWRDGAVLRATRGPSWAGDTNRGTGAGTTELQRVNGLLTNKYAIANGPAAGFGTYVGTIRTNGSATVDWIFGSAAAGGSPASFGVWNAYNRVDVATQVFDSTASWAYVTPSFRAANGSNGNRVWFVCGQSEDVLRASYSSAAWSGGNLAAAFAHVGVGLDSTSVSAGVAGTIVLGSANGGASPAALYEAIAPFGAHYVQALESGQAAVAFSGNGLGGLSFSLKM